MKYYDFDDYEIDDWETYWNFLKHTFYVRRFLVLINHLKTYENEKSR